MGAVHKLKPTQLRMRIADQNNLDPSKPVCIGLFRGDVFTHETFGANRRNDALRAARRIRAQGVSARLAWLNVGPWCAELWTQDLGRTTEIHPDEFYGPLETETFETGVMKRRP